MLLRNSAAAWILAALVAVPAAFCAWELAAWRAGTRCQPGTTPSAYSFSYSDLRPGSTPSCFSAASFDGLNGTRLDLPFRVTPAMLLYWNGVTDSSYAPFSGKRVVLGQSYPAGIYAYDLDARRVLWRRDFYSDRPGLKLSLPINSSSPVINPTTHRLYGTFIEERFHGKDPRSSRLTQHYYSIALDGTDYEEMQVDFSRFLLEKGSLATSDDVHKYIRCRAGLAIEAHGPGQWILSACSIVRAFSYFGSDFIHQKSIQSLKGLRGFLLALPIDSVSGRFGPLDGARAFIASKIGKLAGEGVDAGIWHSGGAPAILPDGQVLLATGNGYYRPEHDVYGCAVVRLREDKLSVEEPGGSYFSARGQDTEEASAVCHSANLDPSSSLPATLKLGDKFFSVIGGKDGWLKSFDPYHLPGVHAEADRESKVVEGFLFGQPVAFASRAFHMIAAIGGNDASGWSWAGYAVGGDYKLRRIWKLSYPHPRSYNSSATGTYREEGLSPLLFIPAVSGRPEADFPSDLMAVDAETGRQLGNFPFHGSVHFSMPTVLDDRVFVPTAEHGIYEFVARHSFREFLKLHVPLLSRFL